MKLCLILAALAMPALAAKPIIGDTPATPPAKPAPAAASTVPEPVALAVGEIESPEKAIARFFAYLQRREVDQAYDQLVRGTVIAQRAEDVKMLKSKTKDAIAVYGVVQGLENVATKRVGERLQRQTVLSLNKDFPLRWRFYFYRVGENWRLIDMRVDDRLAALFDELDEVPKPDAP